METNKKVIYDEITIVKGIAILLVILGHAITQTGQQGFILSKVHEVIYSFHMPLFFFASGFLSARLLDATDWRSRISYGGSRTLRLLIPYFFMGFLYMFAGSYYYKNSGIIGKETLIGMLKGTNPDSELWFLYVMWLITLVVLLFVWRKTLWLCALISVFFCLGSYHWFFANGVIQLVFMFTFYVVFGIIVRRYYYRFKDCLKNPFVFILSLVVFIIGNSGESVIENIKPQFIRDSIPFLSALAGVFVFFMISILIVDNLSAENLFRRILVTCGKYCMDLYVIAEPLKVLVRILFWENLHWNYLFCTGLYFVLPIVGSLFISKYFIRKSKVLSLLILGQWKHEKKL